MENEKETEMEEMEQQLVEVLDEEGNTIELEVLDFVDVEGVEYAVLAPVSDLDEDSDEEEEVEAVLMRVVKDGDDFSLETIEDDEEFNIVADYIASLED